MLHLSLPIISIFPSDFVLKVTHRIKVWGQNIQKSGSFLKVLDGKLKYFLDENPGSKNLGTGRNMEAERRKMVA